MREAIDPDFVASREALADEVLERDRAPTAGSGARGSVQKASVGCVARSTIAVCPSIRPSVGPTVA